jgi:ubiquinone/menaquinone biosynthesis methyltransferase
MTACLLSYGKTASQTRMSEQQQKASFGFRDVNAAEKQGMVREVFSSVAGNYDIMNDVMSAGMHRLWKDRFVREVHVGPNAAILDLAGGTGDIAVRLKKRTKAKVTVCDINADMLSVGRDRQFDRGESEGLRWVCGNAQSLPVPDNSQDIITISFGLRNVTEIDTALRDIYRALKPGGQFLCLEFSKVIVPPVAKIYDLYSFHLIPKFGKLVAKDEASYQYLVESIRMFPSQEELKKRMTKVGFARAKYTNLSMGVVAIHQGWKI